MNIQKVQEAIDSLNYYQKIECYGNSNIVEYSCQNNVLIICQNNKDVYLQDIEINHLPENIVFENLGDLYLKVLDINELAVFNNSGKVFLDSQYFINNNPNLDNITKKYLLKLKTNKLCIIMRSFFIKNKTLHKKLEII
jgi:predicted oxidoreductase